MILAHLISFENQKPEDLEPTPVRFAVQEFLSNIEHLTAVPEEIRIIEPGLYSLLGLFQIGRVSGAIQEFVDVWIQVNRVDVNSSFVRGVLSPGLFVDQTVQVSLHSVLDLKAGDILRVIQSISTDKGGVGIVSCENQEHIQAPSAVLTLRKL